jgi:hypothetical protein
MILMQTFFTDGPADTAAPPPQRHARTVATMTFSQVIDAHAETRRISPRAHRTPTAQNTDFHIIIVPFSLLLPIQLIFKIITGLTIARFYHHRFSNVLKSRCHHPPTTSP